MNIKIQKRANRNLPPQTLTKISKNGNKIDIHPLINKSCDP
jgi:hypothetical protein